VSDDRNALDWLVLIAIVIGALWLFSSLVDASGIAEHHDPVPPCTVDGCSGDGSTGADY
jgi:hypothetical protein